MNGFVTDTHALIWYLSGSKCLGNKARAIFDSTVAGDARILIPAIVVAELIMFAEKHRTIEPDVVLSELRLWSGFRFLALLPETVIKIQNFQLFPDLHDRLIVAEAVLQDLPLITYDQAITDSGLVRVIW